MDSIKFSDGKLIILDQRKLPFKKKYLKCKNEFETANAIKNMAVRGAPAIGIAGAYGIALSKNPKSASIILKKSRPTAVDLFNAIDFMLEGIKEGGEKISLAKKWHSLIIQKTKKISENGASLIKNNSNILLHCNAGPIATAGHGTSLGAVIMAKKMGTHIFVYVDETRPRFQGALTSFELMEAKIPHKIIIDSSAGFFMNSGKIDSVMVGADRIAKNGDFANKIGTYSLAVLAKENKIPFFVFAPISTFDFSIDSGRKIKIEERNENEILEIYRKRVYGKGAKAINPAFDITPAKYVSAYITEYGIFKNTKGIERRWKNTLE
ncbi:MAG: S-methyl-5-thioribose-1-phosphate isomerase [Candidatus Micrarchaeia archaeon]